MPLGEYLNEISFKIRQFSFRKINLKCRLPNGKHLPWPHCFDKHKIPVWFLIDYSRQIRLSAPRYVKCMVPNQINQFFVFLPSVGLASFMTPSLLWTQKTKPSHDDVIKWKQFPRNWPFVRGIHRSPLNSPHKGQRRGALMFSLICVWINDWVNNRDPGDLRRHLAHYDVIVMLCWNRNDQVSIIAVEVPAPCVTSTSAAMIITM